MQLDMSQAHHSLQGLAWSCILINPILTGHLLCEAASPSWHDAPTTPSLMPVVRHGSGQIIQPQKHGHSQTSSFMWPSSMAHTHGLGSPTCLMLRPCQPSHISPSWPQVGVNLKLPPQPRSAHGHLVQCPSPPPSHWGLLRFKVSWGDLP